jgi:phosphate/sulfate permease
MRALGITTAAVLGLFAGTLASNLLAGAVGANESAQAVGTFLGAVVGGIGLAVLVARLIPPALGNLQRGRDILARRDQRIIDWRRR